MQPTRDVTRLLQAWRQGDEGAIQQLIPLVYGELRRLARGCMARERPGHTLQPTALVHEACLRLMGSRNVSWEDRAHFFGIAARQMRQILVGHARSRRAAKRGGGGRRVELDEALLVSREPSPDLVSLHEALTALGARDDRASRVVELRYFGGLSVEETAEVLGISAPTVMRDWRMAKAWLLRQMKRA